MIQKVRRPIPVWRFVHENHRLGHGDGRLMQEGKKLSVSGKPVICRRGFHGSETLRDALDFYDLDRNVLTSSRLSGFICNDDLYSKICGIILHTDRIVSEKDTIKFLAKIMLWSLRRVLKIFPQKTRAQCTRYLNVYSSFINRKISKKEFNKTLLRIDASHEKSCGKKRHFLCLIGDCFDFLNNSYDCYAKSQLSDVMYNCAELRNNPEELDRQEEYANELWFTMFGE